MAFQVTNTRVTQISSINYIVGINEELPAVHYIDDIDNTKQILVYCPSLKIELARRIEFDIKVLKLSPEFNSWVELPYTSQFNIGRMIVDNETYVDQNTGEPLNPQPVDDPNTPQNELDNFIGEYTFWNYAIGNLIEGAIQQGIQRRLVL